MGLKQELMIDQHIFSSISVLIKIFHFAGPKYILKLQQEVTAMRVVISMDSESTVEGASKVHTIKRYLSELKDEEAVSSSSLRCRELDCLRAYYYLSILQFLQQHLNNQQMEEETVTSNQSSDNTNDSTPVKTNCGSTDSIQGNGTLSDSVSTNPESIANVPLDESTNKRGENGSQNGGNDSHNISSINSVPELPPLPSLIKPETSVGGQDSSVSPSTSVDKVSSVKECTEVANGDQSNDNVLFNSETVSKPKVLSMNQYLSGSIQSMKPTYQMTKPVLAHLSRGLLWDMQGKRYALTETLGYIHKAISQLLLAQKPSSSLTQVPSDSMNSIHISDGMSAGGHHYVEGMTSDGDSHLGDQAAAGSSSSHSSPQTSSPKKRHHSEPVIERPPMLAHHTSANCPFHRPAVNLSRSISTDSGAVDMSVPIQEYLSIGDIDLDGPEGPLGICSSCDYLSKSRKVLWEDEPHFHGGGGDQGQHSGGRGSLTSIVNPAKYINVPDEWYNMPADQKYFMPYITMAILKDEQEYMMHELKRGPEALQVSQFDMLATYGQMKLPQSLLVPYNIV